MDWFHIAADMGQNIAILVCLYLIWDLRKEVGALQDRVRGSHSRSSIPWRAAKKCRR